MISHKTENAKSPTMGIDPSGGPTPAHCVTPQSALWLTPVVHSAPLFEAVQHGAHCSARRPAHTGLSWCVWCVSVVCMVCARGCGCGCVGVFVCGSHGLNIEGYGHECCAMCAPAIGCSGVATKKPYYPAGDYLTKGIPAPQGPGKGGGGLTGLNQT